MTELSKLGRMVVIALSVSTLVGCTYRGGDIGDPAVRKFYWFSFVGGDDIRANCGPGTPDRYRLVYNGIYQEQLRIYELDSLQRVLAAHVTDQAGLSRFDAGDLLAPWRAKEASTPVSAQAYDGLMAKFAESGMFAPPPVGLRLPSRSYFWTAAWCKGGTFGFNAWAYPSPRYDAVTFDDALFALDTTGIAVNQAKPVPLDPQYEDLKKRNEVTHFTLTVGANGLVD